MGMFLVSMLAPLTYLHFGGATVFVVKQPPIAPARRPAPTNRQRQDFHGQQFRPANNVFGLDSRSLQWPGSAGRRSDVTFTRQRPTKAWVPEPPGQLTQWPQGHVTQSEWIPIESIPKSNNPSEWIQRRDVPPSTPYKPEVTSRKNVPSRKLQRVNQIPKTKKKKKSLSKKKNKRKISDYETLNLMEEYVNKRLALEEIRKSEAELTTTAPTPSTTATVPEPVDALPPALDFLSGRQFSFHSGSKRDNTFKPNTFRDLQNRPDIQQPQTANPTDVPSLVHVPNNHESVDLFNSAFKAITDAFRLAETSNYSEASTIPSNNNNQHNLTFTPTSTKYHTTHLNVDTAHEHESLTDTLIKEVLSSVFHEERTNIGIDTIPTGYNIDNTTSPDVKPLTPPEELPKGDNQTILEMPIYSLEGKSANHTLELKTATKPVEIETATKESTLHEKQMAYPVDTLTEVTRKTNPPRQIPSPPIEPIVPYESTTVHPQRERRPGYDIFRGRRKQPEVDNLDLFSSEPPVDRNHPFSKGFTSSRYQQFEVRGNHINTDNDLLHREPSTHHSFDHSNSQTYEQPSYYQKHAPPHYDRQNDVRYDKPPHEHRNQYQENHQNTFQRRKPRQWEITNVEVSKPANRGWESQARSVYGIDPSETRQRPYQQTVVEYQSFERRRKPQSETRQPPRQTSSHQSHSTWTQSTWSDPNRPPEYPYVREVNRHAHDPDPYAASYMRRNRPPLSHYEKSAVVRTGQGRDAGSNQGPRSPAVYNTIENTTPATTTEDPPTEPSPGYRSNNEIGSLQSWPQRHSSGRTWESVPAAPQSTSWAGTETNSNGWERRDNGRTNGWQHSVPTQTDAWTRHDTGYDAQGGYNTQNEIYGNNEQSEYGQENTQHSYTEHSEFSNTGYTEYNTQEGYNNEAQTIDYTDGEGNGGDDSDEDDR